MVPENPVSKYRKIVKFLVHIEFGSKTNVLRMMSQ